MHGDSMCATSVLLAINNEHVQHSETQLVRVFVF
jgi:hypothetical protein